MRKITFDLETKNFFQDVGSNSTVSHESPSAICSRITETGILVPLMTGRPLHTLGLSSILFMYAMPFSFFSDV